MTDREKGRIDLEAAFWHYKPIDSADESDLWEHAIVTLDTNCLLHLYRYSPTTRTEFLKSLTYLKSQNRLWICHQVGDEFFRNRPAVALQVRDNLRQTKQLIEEAEKHITSIVKQKEDVQEILNSIASLKRDVKNMVEDISASGDKEPVPQHDDVLREIIQIFDEPSMLGPSFSTDELTRIYAEGRVRYEQQVPPGYMDATKTEPQRYGDLVLWKQLIDYSRHQNRPVILVTDDVKEDWWFQIGATKSTRMPHPKLRLEFQEATGNMVWFYQRDDFLREAKRRLNLDISEAAIEEVSSSQESMDTGYAHYTSAAYPLSQQLADAARAMENYQALSKSASAALFPMHEMMKQLYDSPAVKLATGQYPIGLMNNAYYQFLLRGLGNNVPLNDSGEEAVDEEAGHDNPSLDVGGGDSSDELDGGQAEQPTDSEE